MQHAAAGNMSSGWVWQDWRYVSVQYAAWETCSSGWVWQVRRYALRNGSEAWLSQRDSGDHRSAGLSAAVRQSVAMWHKCPAQCDATASCTCMGTATHTTSVFTPAQTVQMSPALIFVTPTW